MRRFLTGLLICAALLAHSSPAFAADNFAQADELFPEQANLSAIGAPELWNKLSQSSKLPGGDAVVAVIDTGLSLSPDIEDNLWTNLSELNGREGVDDDNNGYIDDVHGLSLTKDEPTTDTNGHGTMMSGIIAMGKDNGGGVGIAYGAKIMPVKISKNKNFGIDDLIEGINYASDNGADVISMSLGTIYPTGDLKEAVQNAAKSSILVAAAGNENRRASKSVYQSCVYPAAYPEVIGVMSTDNDGNMSEFTNWCDAEEQIYELTAPGEKILSAHLNKAYKAESGTSQSAAQVAAAAAAAVSLFPNESPSVLRQKLIECMEHKTAFDEAHGGEHRRLYLPDILNITPEAALPAEPDSKTIQPSSEIKAKPVAVAKGKVYTAGSGKSKAKYLVKSTKKRTVFYKKCAVSKSSKTADVPKSVRLDDGRRYTVTGISPKAFANRKSVKTLTLKSTRLKKSTVKNSLKNSRITKLRIKVGTKKQNKKYRSVYRLCFSKKLRIV